MKKIIIILSVIILIIAALWIYAITQKSTTLPIIEHNPTWYTWWIKSFSFQEWNWWTYWFEYNVRVENDKIELEYLKRMGAREEKPQKVKISKEELQKLEKMIEENNIKSRNWFDKYDPDVLDWTSRYIGIYYNNWNDITAHWYMKRPNWFREKIEPITSYLNWLLGIENK